MKYVKDDRLNKLINEKINQGWSSSIGRNSYKLKHPLGGIVSMSKTPSCPFFLKHTIGDIKRLERKNCEKRHIQSLKKNH